jgi:hypothetical protein
VTAKQRPGWTATADGMTETDANGLSPPPVSRVRRHLPAIATALGLFATLWATLWGQTLPEMLRGDATKRFRGEMGSACAAAHADLRRPRYVPDLAWRGGSDPPETFGRLKAVVRLHLPQFVALAPPDQFAHDYNQFMTGWRHIAKWDLIDPVPEQIRDEAFEAYRTSPLLRVEDAVDAIASPECQTFSVDLHVILLHESQR